MVLIRLAAAWFAGLALAEVAHPPWWMALASAAVLAAACSWRRLDPRLRWAAALALVSCLGTARAGWANRPRGPDHVQALNGQGEATLRGLIASEPKRRDRGMDYRVAVSALRSRGAWRPAQGLVLVQLPRFPAQSYGDTVVLTGTLETPPVLEDFDYRAYLARQGIHSLLRRPRWQVVAEGGGNPLRRGLLAVKDWARRGLAAALPEPEASLATGILLGDDDGIPRPVADAFRITNTSHVIAISGSNIALLVTVLVATLSPLIGRRRAFPVILVVLTLYTALVGADAAVVRAAVMGCIMLLGSHLGRPGHAATALCAAGWLMTLYRPAYLLDLGFQLSFAATAGLILFASRFADVTERHVEGLSGPDRARAVVGRLNEVLLVTLAAQLTTWPLIAYHTGQVSLIGLVANALILPAQPPVMGLGALAAVAGGLAPDLGRAFGAVAWLPLAWTVRVVEAMARLPLAAVTWHMGLGELGVYYVVLGVSAAKAAAWGPFGQASACADAGGDGRRASDEVGGWWVVARERVRLPAVWLRWLPLPLSVCVCALAWVAALARPDGRLHVFALDVGQGDAIYVVTPNGRRLLMDGGPGPGAVLDQLGRRLAPWDRRLDVVVLSHPDADHVAGLPAVLERYQVGHILDPQLEAGSGDAQAWRAAVEQEGAERARAEAGGRLVLDEAAGVVADVLWPPEPRFTGTDRLTNNNAVVLRLAYGATSFLLTADVEEPAEERLLRSGVNLRATVLKVGHHGSRTSTTPAFLAAVSPWLALISVGADNDYGHPAPEVMERLASVPVLRTDQDGTVEVVSDGVGVWVR